MTGPVRRARSLLGRMNTRISRVPEQMRTRRLVGAARETHSKEFWRSFARRKAREGRSYWPWNRRRSASSWLDGRAQAALAIAGVTWRPLAIAALLASLLPALDSLILAKYAAVPTLDAGAPAVGESAAHRMYERFGSFCFTSWQVSASLLGLYFAAFSVIVSTSYSAISRDVRRLIIHERMSDNYLRIIAFYVIVSGAYSITTVIDADLTLVSVGWVALLGLFAFVSFPILGLRLFYLLEPKELAPYPMQGLATAIRRALPDSRNRVGRRTAVGSRREAERSLVLFKELVGLASRRGVISPSDLSQDVQALFGVLLWYGECKGKIPRGSPWFRPVASHPRWVSLDESQLSVALHSATPVQPTNEPDYLWLEREVLDCLNAAFAAGEQVEGWGTEIQAVATGATGWVRTLAAAGLIEESELVAGTLVRLAKDHAGRPYPGADADAPTAVKLAASSLRGYAAASVVLGMFDYVRTISLDRIAAIADGISRGKPQQSEGNQAEPHQVKVRIERLLAERSVEVSIEGRTVTKAWYYEAQLADAFRSWIQEAIGACSTLVNGIVTTAERAIDDKDLEGASALIPQGLQAVARLQRNLRAAEDLDQRLGEMAGRALPERSNGVDWQLTVSEADGAWRKLHDLWPGCLPFLFDFDDSPNLPDLPGEAFAFLAEETLRRLGLGEPEEAVAPLLKAGLGLGLDQRRRAAERSDLQASVDASLDILALTGYAELYGALHSTEVGQVLRQRWNALLSDPATAGDRLKSFVAAYELRHDTGFSGRSLTRTRWHMQTARNFGERGLDDWDPAMFAITRRGPAPPWHSSPLVMAASAGGTMMFEDGETVALAIVLAPLARQLGIPVPRRVQEFSDRLERWELRMSAAATDEAAGGEDGCL